MENAAKALIIAGGILLAIMTLTLLVYGLTASSRLEQATAENKKNEEIASFNLEYQAFNKKRMYGIDLITLINKAINHNKTMDSSHPYYVNIIFKTKEDFKNEIYIYIYNNTTKEVEYEKYGADPTDSHIPTDPEWSKVRDVNISTRDIEGNKEYKLLSFSGKQAIINKDFKNIFEDGFKEDFTRTKIVPDGGQSKTVTCTVYSALTNFKRAIFECTNVEYDSNTGRINKLEFAQVEKNEEIYKPQ